MKWTIDYFPREDRRIDRKPFVCYSDARCFNPCRKSAKGIDRAMINGDIKDISHEALDQIKRYRSRKKTQESIIRVYRFA